MTKVQLEYELVRPLDDDLLAKISKSHGIYGFFRVSLKPSLDRLVVEYDASRLSPLEVEHQLQSLGIPVVLSV